MKSAKKLNTEQLANLYTQLSRLEAAGLPGQQALQLLSEYDKTLAKPLSIMQQQLKAGRPISEAGFRIGLFDKTHSNLIRAAELSGQLDKVYTELARQYTLKSSRVKKIKSRLYFPLTILVLSVFIDPIPAYVLSAITGLDYLKQTLGSLLSLGLGGYILLKLPRICAGLSIEKSWHGLQIRLPIVRNWTINRQINDFLMLLALMLEAGLAFTEAFPQAVASIKNSKLREAFNQAATPASLERGASVADILSKIAIIKPNILQIVQSNEHSGKLSSGLLHFTRLEAENLMLQDDALAEWIPRLVYCAIALWMAYSILHSPFMMPVTPNQAEY